jgi:hypothetical protein
LMRATAGAKRRDLRDRSLLGASAMAIGSRVVHSAHSLPTWRHLCLTDPRNTVKFVQSIT